MRIVDKSIPDRSRPGLPTTASGVAQPRQKNETRRYLLFQRSAILIVTASSTGNPETCPNPGQIKRSHLPDFICFTVVITF